MDISFLQALAICKAQGKTAKDAFIAYKLGVPVKCGGGGGGGGGDLPADYAQVEYVEATGAQYIDTGFLIEANSKCEIVQQYTQRTLQSFGSISVKNNVLVNRFYCRASDGFYWLIGEEHNGNKIKTFDADIHTFIADCTTGKCYVDTTFIETNVRFVSNAQNVTFTLFAINNAQLKDVEPTKNYAKLYSAKFWYGDNLVRDFVPVVRKSDNVGGLWDKVEKKFYSSNTTTPFIVP